MRNHAWVKVEGARKFVNEKFDSWGKSRHLLNQMKLILGCPMFKKQRLEVIGERHEKLIKSYVNSPFLSNYFAHGASAKVLSFT